MRLYLQICFNVWLEKLMNSGIRKSPNRAMVLLRIGSGFTVVELRFSYIVTVALWYTISVD